MLRFGLICWLLTLATFVCAEPKHGNPVLLLIQPANASGSNSIEAHGGPWVLWPTAVSGTHNRLLAVATGLAWHGSPGDSRFVSVGVRSWAPANLAAFVRRGEILARDAHLEKGWHVRLLALGPSVSTSALLLSVPVQGNTIDALRLSDPWPENAVLVGQARGWDEVEAVRNATTGRIAVVEYPPPLGENLSRAWLYGPWPPGMPEEHEYRAPSLLAAKCVFPALQHPAILAWSSARTKNSLWEWSSWGDTSGVALLVIWSAICAAILIGAIVLIMRECRSPAMALLLEIIVLSPAANFLSGSVAASLGLGSFPFLFVILSVMLWLIACALRVAMARAGFNAHPWFPLAVLGLAATLYAGPTFSLWSPVFSASPESSQAESYGALLAYAAGCGFLAPLHGPARPVVNLVPLILAVVAAFLPSWWTAGGLMVPALFLAAWAIGETKPTFTIVAFTAAVALAVALLKGYAVIDQGLIAELAQAEAIDVSGYARAFASPALWLLLVSAGLLTLFGDRFFVHRLRSLMRADPRRKELLCLAACVAAAGIFQPWFVVSAVVVFVGAIALPVRDALVEADIEG